MTHLCHWPGCLIEVPPRMFMCRVHWLSLPKEMRREIWCTYRKGQEITKNPDPEYLAAARAALDWVARKFPPRQKRIAV